jgi:hypothetical protein
VLPVIDHPALAGLIDQLSPEGSGSLTATPVAVPVPAALLLLTVTSNPIWSPAETGPAGLAVFVIDTFGHRTVTEAEELLFVVFVSLVAEMLAVLLTAPQLAADVVAATWTDEVAPAAKVVGE